jgi:hypothetical protein
MARLYASYCAPADLAQTGTQLAKYLDMLPTAALQSYCDEASDEVDSYLNAQFQPPYSNVALDVKRHTINLALEIAFDETGYPVGVKGDVKSSIEKKAERSRKRLQEIAERVGNPNMVDATPAGKPLNTQLVYSDKTRGFQPNTLNAAPVGKRGNFW